MGWQEILAGYAPAAVERSTYESAVQNELRQAQAQQLIQEAMSKQIMLPYNIKQSIATANQMNAQADQMRREKMVDPKKAVEAQKLQMELLHPALGAMIEPILKSKNKQGKFAPNLWEDNASQLDPIIKQLEDAGLQAQADILRSKNYGQVESLYSRMGLDKQRASLDKEGMRGQTAITINTDTNASKERIAKDRNTALLNIAEERTKAAKDKPSKESYENAAVAIRRAADREEDQERAEKLYKKAAEYDDLARQYKASSAIAGPGAKSEAQIETLRKIDEWNKNMSGGGRANKTTEPKKLTIEDMRKGL